MRKAVIFTAAAAIGLCGGLYLALSESESPTAAQAIPQQDTTAIEALRSGDMMKLQFAANRGSSVAFLGEDGTEMTLADYEGKTVVLNFWATWCAPCRKEMPHLSQLQSELAGDDFAVVTVATGLNQRPAMERFFADIGVDNLPLHTDASSAFARDFGVVGLPATLILNRQGFEIARLQGDADWTSDSAVAILRALIAAE